jgi:hypothetical protein
MSDLFRQPEPTPTPEPAIPTPWDDVPAKPHVSESQLIHTNPAPVPSSPALRAAAERWNREESEPPPAPVRVRAGEVCYIRVRVLGGIRNFDDCPAVQVRPIGRDGEKRFKLGLLLSVPEDTLLKAGEIMAAIRGDAA